MSGISQADLRRKEAVVLSACMEQLLSRPLDSVTIKSVAESAGLPEWSAYRAAYRVARNRDHLLRRAVQELADEIARRITAFPECSATVHGTIEAIVSHAAAVMAQPDFGRFFRLVVAQQPFQPWLHEIYEQKLAGAFCRRLEESVRTVGRRLGMAICFRAGAPRFILRQLEQAICLPPLLPGHDPVDEDRAERIRSIAQHAFSLSYAWDLGAAA